MAHCTFSYSERMNARSLAKENTLLIFLDILQYV